MVQIHADLLKPVHFIFCVIIMVIPSMICFPSFLTISYRFQCCFCMFPLVFLPFPREFLLFPFTVSPIFYFRFCVHIFPNISRSKSDQTMKICQVIENNNRNIFLQKLFTKWGREISSRSRFVFQNGFISGKSKWSAAYF